MLKIIVISVIAVTASNAAAAASVPKPCCLPHQWSVNRLSIGASINHGSHKADIIEEELEVFYDWDERMIVIIQHRVNQTTGQRFVTTIRQDYRYNTNYITSPDGKCHRQHLEANSMFSPCFLANFTYWGTKTVGAGSNGIRANGFSGYINQYTVKVMLTAGQHCHLVSFMKFGDDAKARNIGSYIYVNWQENVPAPLFAIPRNCANAPVIPPNKRSLGDYMEIPEIF